LAARRPWFGTSICGSRIPSMLGRGLGARATLARVQQRQDVGVLELGRGLDLPREPIAPERGGQLGAQHLDRDLAMVLDVEGKIDGRHPARAKLALYAVAAGQRLRHTLESVGHARLTCGWWQERASRQLVRLVPALVGRVKQARGEASRPPSLLPTPNPLHALREKGENRVSPYPPPRIAMWLAAAP